MKFLIPALLIAASVATAESSKDVSPAKKHGQCTTSTYTCADGTTIGIDVCAGGYTYLQGTNIPFTGSCDTTGG